MSHQLISNLSQTIKGLKRQTANDKLNNKRPIKRQMNHQTRNNAEKTDGQIKQQSKDTFQKNCLKLLAPTYT